MKRKKNRIRIRGLFKWMMVAWNQHMYSTLYTSKLIFIAKGREEFGQQKKLWETQFATKRMCGQINIKKRSQYQAKGQLYKTKQDKMKIHCTHTYYDSCVLYYKKAHVRFHYMYSVKKGYKIDVISKWYWFNLRSRFSLNLTSKMSFALCRALLKPIQCKLFGCSVKLDERSL